MQDIFVPTSRPEDGLVGPLHTVTYVTAAPDEVGRAFVEGFELGESDALTNEHTDDQGARTRLSLAEIPNWRVRAYTASGEAANIQVRVVGVGEDQPVVRSEYMGLHLGGATVGFPITDLPTHAERMENLGFQSTVGVKELEFTSPEGQTYISAEVLYLAPENVFLLGVMRPDIFVPVGPMAAGRGIGGPAYSARCVSDADAAGAFLDEVLGFEKRRDMELPIGENSALLLPAGMDERFIQAFAPGSSSGYLVMMDHRDANLPEAAASRSPHRGIVMWSFETTDLDAVYQKAQAFGARILQEPSEGPSPFIPARRVMQVEDPCGFPYEIFER